MMRVSVVLVWIVVIHSVAGKLYDDRHRGHYAAKYRYDYTEYGDKHGPYYRVHRFKKVPEPHLPHGPGGPHHGGHGGHPLPPIHPQQGHDHGYGHHDLGYNTHGYEHQNHHHYYPDIYYGGHGGSVLGLSKPSHGIKIGDYGHYHGGSVLGLNKPSHGIVHGTKIGDYGHYGGSVLGLNKHQGTKIGDYGHYHGYEHLDVAYPAHGYGYETYSGYGTVDDYYGGYGDYGGGYGGLDGYLGHASHAGLGTTTGGHGLMIAGYDGFDRGHEQHGSATASGGYAKNYGYRTYGVRPRRHHGKKHRY